MQSRAQLEHTKLSQMVSIYFMSNLMANKTKLFWILRHWLNVIENCPLSLGNGHFTRPGGSLQWLSELWIHQISDMTTLGFGCYPG
jgi:hypothetical protein